MSSSRTLCCLSSVKKQKHDFQVCFVDRERHRKNSGIWLFTILMFYFQFSLFIAIYFLNQPLFNFFAYCLMLRLFCQSNHVPVPFFFTRLEINYQFHSIESCASDLYIFTRLEINCQFHSLACQCIIIQLLDSVFVISTIIKVSVRLISLSIRL